MAYGTGTEAVWLDGAEQLRQVPRRQRARSFEVIEGEGLDARARQGVGAGFIALLVKVAMGAALLIALGVCRVAVSSATVSVLKENASMQASIKSGRAMRADLEVQRSVLSAGTRIDRIATQNLGMVLATSGEVIDVSAYFPKADAQDEVQLEAGEEDSSNPVGEAEGMQDATTQPQDSPAEDDFAAHAMEALATSAEPGSTFADVPSLS